DRHDVVDVQQRRIALDHDRQLNVTRESEPRGTIADGVRLSLVGNSQRLTHARAAFDVPRLTLGRDTRLLPEAQLELLGARVVAARDERRLPVGDRAERCQRVRLALDPGWIYDRADDQKVVVHDQPALDAVAFGHPLHFAGWRVDQHDVCFATPRQRQSGAGTDT